MEAPSNDTDKRAGEVQLALLRKMTPADKMRRVQELNQTVWTLARQGQMRRWPGATESELRFRLAALSLGDALTALVYGRPDGCR